MEELIIPMTEFQVGPAYFVRRNVVSQIDPTHPEAWADFDLDALWPFFFIQDMAVIQRHDGQSLIDIGWHPDGEKEGFFRLEIVPKDIDGSFDHGNETNYTFETRSLQALVEKVRDITS